MSNPTPPLLDIKNLEAGDFRILHAYQGIRFTIIPDGGECSYSFIDDDSGSAEKNPVHDPLTKVTVDVLTTVDLTWPFILVTCDTGTARVALV